MTDASPLSAGGVGSITPAELRERIDAGEERFLLDTRSPDEFDAWHIDAEPVDIVNYPYFRLLDGLPDELLEELPDDRPTTVLCAKGGASELIAEQLDDAGFSADHLEEGMLGWARLYESVELDVDADATIVQYHRPSSGCLSYLVVSAGEAAIIDPLRVFTDRYLDDLQRLGADLVYALDTHVHADHLSGIRELGASTDATAVLPTPAAERGVTYDVPYGTVTDGETLTVGDVTVAVIHTPGHTTGMTSYKVGEVLFTGDGLFIESLARPDLEDPDAARRAARTLHASLREKLLPFPDETVVAPAHVSDAAVPNDDGSFTAELGHLRAGMDVLRLDEEAFAERIVSGMPPRPANYEAIIDTNLGRRSPDDEEAFELELGPNNCAASEGALLD